MNKTYTLPKDELRGELYRRIFLLIRKSMWTRQSLGATFGLAGGLLSISLGTLLWTTVQFIKPGNFASFLNAVEVVFFVLSLPLLALGAYCLDLLEKQPPLLPLPTQSDGFARWRPLRHQTYNKN